MAQSGKRLRASYESIDREKTYTLPEAVKLIKGAKHPKFDETVEIAINLNVDP